MGLGVNIKYHNVEVLHRQKRRRWEGSREGVFYMYVSVGVRGSVFGGDFVNVWPHVTQEFHLRFFFFNLFVPNAPFL